MLWILFVFVLFDLARLLIHLCLIILIFLLLTDAVGLLYSRLIAHPSSQLLEDSDLVLSLSFIQGCIVVVDLWAVLIRVSHLPVLWVVAIQDDSSCQVLLNLSLLL